MPVGVHSGLFLLEDQFWVARGRARIPFGTPVPDEEWPLELGTYKPGPLTTGPRPFLDDGVTPRVLERVDGDLRITTPNTIVQNKDVYGRIIFTSSAINCTVRNCIVRGPGKGYTGTGFTACITGSTSSVNGLVIEDTRIDCTGREHPLVDAIRESDITVRRTEITRTCDGGSAVTPKGNQTFEGNWVHDGYYAEWVKGSAGWPSSPSDARVHGDGFQLQLGKNLTYRFNNIGGVRHPGPYHPSPYTTVDASMVAYKDGGDDYENACFMIKQERSDTAADKLENILIEGNWLAGGAASINLSYDRNNPLATLTIINNKFTRSTWGSHLYIIKDTAITATLSGNVFEDAPGTLVPISKGK
jgi:hypothetical protein